MNFASWLFPKASSPLHRSDLAWVVAAACLLCLWLDYSAVAQTVESAVSPGKVVARVDGHDITDADVDSALAAALGGRHMAPQSLPRARAEVLAQLVDRYLVERLARQELGATARNVDTQIEKLKAQLASQSVSLDDYLRRRHLTLPALRAQLTWQAAWQQYLDRNLTDDVLRDYFEKHRQQFDGTELRVSHVLLRPERAGEPPAAVLARGAALHKDIEAGKVSFDEAVRKHSAGPSRGRAGDLGLIPRHGVMHEAFSQAAFALDKGQFSRPVLTPFGVHLIKVTDVKPGLKTWRDARDELKAPAAQALFTELAAAQRPKAKIEFTGVMPHFEPGTTKLVEGASGRAKD